MAFSWAVGVLQCNLRNFQAISEFTGFILLPALQGHSKLASLCSQAPPSCSTPFLPLAGIQWFLWICFVQVSCVRKCLSDRKNSLPLPPLKPPVISSSSSGLCLVRKPSCLNSTGSKTGWGSMDLWSLPLGSDKIRGVHLPKFLSAKGADLVKLGEFGVAAGDLQWRGCAKG